LTHSHLWRTQPHEKQTHKWGDMGIPGRAQWPLSDHAGGPPATEITRDRPSVYRGQTGVFPELAHEPLDTVRTNPVTDGLSRSRDFADPITSDTDPAAPRTDAHHRNPFRSRPRPWGSASIGQWVGRFHVPCVADSVPNALFISGRNTVDSQRPLPARFPRCPGTTTSYRPTGWPNCSPWPTRLTAGWNSGGPWPNERRIP
jgi:hypothetical protein